MTKEPAWRRGKPNAVGLWVCYQNGEPVACEVEMDKDDEGPPYLRVDVNGDSWPVAEYPWGLSPSFGPIKPKRNRGR